MLGATLNGIFLSWWRRLYGEGKITGLLGNRTFQAVLFIIVQTIFWYGTTLWGGDWKEYIWPFAIAIWVYAMYWSRAIGCVLDCGEAWWQTHKNYDRWWTHLVNEIAHLLGLHKYYGAYDAIWMTFRYTLCLLPLALPFLGAHQIWVAGLFAAPIYYGCKYLFKRFPSLYKWFDDSKDLAEYIFGFTSGVIFYAFW